MFLWIQPLETKEKWHHLLIYTAYCLTLRRNLYIVHLLKRKTKIPGFRVYILLPFFASLDELRHLIIRIRKLCWRKHKSIGTKVDFTYRKPDQKELNQETSRRSFPLAKLLLHSLTFRGLKMSYPSSFWLVKFAYLRCSCIKDEIFFLIIRVNRIQTLQINVQITKFYWLSVDSTWPT